MEQRKSAIWIFADYRNYFQNRVTLQLLAKANDLASELGAEVCGVVFGYETDEYVAEYIAHGAHRVIVTEDPSLKQYSVEKYAFLMEKLARQYQPVLCSPWGNTNRELNITKLVSSLRLQEYAIFYKKSRAAGN